MQVRPSGSEHAVPALHFYRTSGQSAAELPLLDILQQLLPGISWPHAIELLSCTQPDRSGQIQQLIVTLERLLSTPTSATSAASAANLQQLTAVLAGATLEMRCCACHLAVLHGSTDLHAAGGTFANAGAAGALERPFLGSDVAAASSEVGFCELLHPPLEC
jgi:hypothetical protein